VYGRFGKIVEGGQIMPVMPSLTSPLQRTQTVTGFQHKAKVIAIKQLLKKLPCLPLLWPGSTRYPASN
jgi:hypothetical protein